MNHKGAVYVVSSSSMGLRPLLVSGLAVFQVFGLRTRISQIRGLPTRWLRPFPDMLFMIHITDGGFTTDMTLVKGIATITLNDLMDNDEEVFFSRIYKEVSFRTGISLGLSQCSDYTCLMGPSESLESVDRKGFFLCGSCQNRLDKLLRPSSS